MKKILAVSGGVDSMLLLWRFRNDKDAVVAHFNHGTRASADTDYEFVRREVEKYGLKLFYEKASLGEDVSEADARIARYNFLFGLQQRLGAETVIYTAHHLNDLAESIAINLTRGTGWRGLTPFSDARIKRYFIDEEMTKNDILIEAAKNQIAFRQDPTNVEDGYLRNRLRAYISKMKKDDLLKIYKLYQEQVFLREEIEQESRKMTEAITDNNKYDRKIFSNVDDGVALEIVRAILSKNNLSLTRPQMKDFLTAIINYLPGKKFNLPGNRMAEIRRDWFIV